MRHVRKVLAHVFVLSAVLWLLISFTAPRTAAQVSNSTGSITGTVTDPVGAAVADAKVTVSNKETGTSQTLKTNSDGSFTSGALPPGNYQILIESPNFRTIQSTTVVQVGQVTTFNPRLELGASSSIIEVTGSTVQINSEQATVQDVLTA